MALSWYARALSARTLRSGCIFRSKTHRAASGTCVSSMSARGRGTALRLGTVSLDAELADEQGLAGLLAAQTAGRRSAAVVDGMLIVSMGSGLSPRSISANCSGESWPTCPRASGARRKGGGSNCRWRSSDAIIFADLLGELAEGRADHLVREYVTVAAGWRFRTAVRWGADGPSRSAGPHPGCTRCRTPRPRWRVSPDSGSRPPACRCA